MTNTMNAPALKPVRFDLIQPPEDLGPIELVVDDHFIKTYAFTVDDHHPWHFDDAASPFGARVGQAALFLGDLLRLLNTRYDPNQDVGLHQKESVWFDSPVRLGERVRLSGRIVETYERRGRGYFVTDAQVTAVSDGRSIVRHRATETVDIGDADRLGGGSAATGSTRRVGGVHPTDRPVVSFAGASASPGAPLPTLTKVVHQEQMSVYSNVQQFWRTTHTDRAVAEAEGLETTLAQGLMGASYVSELATRFFGPSWFTTGHLELAFIAPMLPGDEVRVLGVVSEPEEGSDPGRLEIEAWVERVVDGRKLTVGWADAAPMAC
jgi:acyl dehydratase